MAQTYIKTLTDKDGNTIAPRTRVEAITLSDGTTKLEDQLLTLEDGVISNPLPVNADTLDGELPSYYATASNLTNGLALKANAADAALTGVPTAPTAPVGTNTSQVATTAYVRTEVAAIVDAAPETLDTLNELAAALGDDPNFAATTAMALGLKAPIASPTFTGTVSLPSTTNLDGSSLQTQINSKTSTGKAIAMAIVFGG